MEKIIQVSNIKCGGCANSITNALSKIQGISDIEVNVEYGTISVRLDSENLIEKVQDKLESMGYPIGTPTLIQNAKSYVSCAIGRLKPTIDTNQSHD